MPTSRYDRTPEATARARALRKATSRTERKLWPRLRNNQLGAPFRRQHFIAGFYADYCCVPLKLVIEIDGPRHDQPRDAKRDAILAERGFDVIRFTMEDMDERFESVVETIHAEVQIRLLAKQVEEK